MEEDLPEILRWVAMLSHSFVLNYLDQRADYDRAQKNLRQKSQVLFAWNCSNLLKTSLYLVGCVISGIHIPHHVQVIVVNINDFDGVLIDEAMGNRPGDVGGFAEINCAFKVSVMQLCGSNQRVEPGWVDIVRNKFFDDSHVIAMLFIEEGDTTLGRAGSFQSSHDFVITWHVQGACWCTRG
jgi:hypothetical protein